MENRVIYPKVRWFSGFYGRAYFVKKGNVIAGVDIWGESENMMSDNKKMYNSIDVDGRKNKRADRNYRGV
ncbi:MAG: hypothetical protein IPO01_00810 [Chitinophagaceae bacterium]|nr:hypothetical protein [Chitinophagaceae bacterium]